MPNQVHVLPKTSNDAPPPYGAQLGISDQLAPFQRHVRNKFCYNSHAIDKATVVAVKARVAYQTELWSLMEKRWIVWKEKPYNNEPVLGKDIGNLFTNYQLDTPPTIIEGKQTIAHDLTDSQQFATCDSCRGSGKYDCTTCRGKTRTNCYSCNQHGYLRNGSICQSCHGTGTVRCADCIGSGKKNCDRCNTSGKILKWPILNVEWSTVHSTSFSQNANPALTNKYIQKTGSKQCFFDVDQLWDKQTNISSLNNLSSKITSESPLNFLRDIELQYTENHFYKVRDDTNIVRLKCSIDFINISEIDYSSPAYENKTNPSKGT